MITENTEISTQSILNEINAFQNRHSLSLENVSTITKVSEVAIDSFRNTPFLTVDPSYLQKVQQRIEEWETTNSYPIGVIQPQQTVSSDNTDSLKCDSCLKEYPSAKSYNGHLRHCGKSESDQKEIGRKSALTRQKKNVIEFDGNPPSVTIKLSRIEDIPKYIDFDSYSQHIFTQDEDGSVTIYRA